MIVLDDYLEIRPENKDKILQYINEGRISVGPLIFYQICF